MSEDEMWKIAFDIAQSLLTDADYSLVYEDERCEGLSDEEMQHIHSLIVGASVFV